MAKPIAPIPHRDGIAPSFVGLPQGDWPLILDFLIQKKVLLVQGTAFNWNEPDHLRIVFLPIKEEITKAIKSFGEFLKHYKFQ